MCIFDVAAGSGALFSEVPEEDLCIFDVIASCSSDKERGGDSIAVGFVSAIVRRELGLMGLVLSFRTEVSRTGVSA